MRAYTTTAWSSGGRGARWLYRCSQCTVTHKAMPSSAVATSLSGSLVWPMCRPGSLQQRAEHGEAAIVVHGGHVRAQCGACPLAEVEPEPRSLVLHMQSETAHLLFSHNVHLASTGGAGVKEAPRIPSEVERIEEHSRAIWCDMGKRVELRIHTDQCLSTQMSRGHPWV
mmetsp:Transcript_1629/g.5097  ORF Transcript_1629/g.5097 Transcript_1629/m.5097 type:complete len:169 (-) Transcript_1629:1662-2168(-)